MMIPDFPGSPGELLKACVHADTAARLLVRFGRARPSLDEELCQYEALRRGASPEVARDFLRLEPWSAPVARLLENIRVSVAEEKTA
jgi:hypothetical protein